MDYTTDLHAIKELSRICFIKLTANILITMINLNSKEILTSLCVTKYKSRHRLAIEYLKQLLIKLHGT